MGGAHSPARSRSGRWPRSGRPSRGAPSALLWRIAWSRRARGLRLRRPCPRSAYGERDGALVRHARRTSSTSAASASSRWTGGAAASAAVRPHLTSPLSTSTAVTAGRRSSGFCGAAAGPTSSTGSTLPDSNTTIAGADRAWEASWLPPKIRELVSGSGDWPGYHRDDWESVQVRLDLDGRAWVRASPTATTRAASTRSTAATAGSATGWSRCRTEATPVTSRCHSTRASGRGTAEAAPDPARDPPDPPLPPPRRRRQAPGASGHTTTPRATSAVREPRFRADPARSRAAPYPGDDEGRLVLGAGGVLAAPGLPARSMRSRARPAGIQPARSTSSEHRRAR